MIINSEVHLWVLFFSADAKSNVQELTMINMRFNL
jgi:hypothetical protein